MYDPFDGLEGFERCALCERAVVRALRPLGTWLDVLVRKISGAGILMLFSGIW